LVLLACLGAAGPAAAATWADQLFDELSKDFGSVPRGPTLTHHFRVVNKTNVPVNISGLRVSCGCVTPSALKYYLAPGEETAIVAQMDTTRFIGPKTVTIYVQFDRPSYEEVRLWVQANGRNDFNVNPDTLAFGQVKRGSTPANVVAITFYGNSDSRITEVKSESNYVLPSVREVRRLDSEVTYELIAKLRHDVPVGKWYTDIWMKTNNPEMPQVRVPLTVQIESALSITPDAISLGAIRANGESERRVILRGVKPFRIVRVQGTDKNLQVRDNTLDSKPVHILTVKLHAQQPGQLQRMLRILTDMPGDNRVDLRVSASVMP
jgi:hypothetical protein